MENIASINVEAFFKGNKQSYHTYVWLGKSFIEIAIANTANTKIEAIKVYDKTNGNITRDEALTIFKQPEIKNASKVYIGIESNKFTLIPNELFDLDLGKQYLEYIFELENIENHLIQSINQANCQSLYTIKNGTKQLIENELKKAKIFHSPSSLLVAYDKITNTNEKWQSYIRLNSLDVLITIYQDKKLQLHQSYPIDKIEDALFYFLDALRQLNIERDEMQASIFGRNEGLDSFKDLLDNNIKSAQLIKRISFLRYADPILEQPAHKFFNLIAHVLCA